jgi:hypothetical protein
VPCRQHKREPLPFAGPSYDFFHYPLPFSGQLINEAKHLSFDSFLSTGYLKRLTILLNSTCIVFIDGWALNEQMADR